MSCSQVSGMVMEGVRERLQGGPSFFWIIKVTLFFTKDLGFIAK